MTDGQPKVYSGICAGGPKDGHAITSLRPNVRIPVPGTFAPGLYKWNDAVQMWDWHGIVDFDDV